MHGDPRAGPRAARSPSPSRSTRSPRSTRCAARSTRPASLIREGNAILDDARPDAVGRLAPRGAGRDARRATPRRPLSGCAAATSGSRRWARRRCSPPRPRCSPRRSTRRSAIGEAERFCSASERDGGGRGPLDAGDLARACARSSSPAGAGSTRPRRSPARRSRSSRRPTCSPARATRCSTSPRCCGPRAAPDDADAAVGEALDRYSRKGNVVGAERARSLLATIDTR